MILLSDPFVLVSIIGLIATSLFLIGSTASTLLNAQSFFFASGLVLFFVFSRIPLSVWRRLVWILYIFSLLFLSVVLLSPHVRGASRWIEIAGIQLQPSELLKPVVILIIAHFAAIKKPTHMKPFLILIGLIFPILFLIFRQPDLGNVLVYIVFFLSIMIIAGFPWKYLFVGLFGFILLLPLLWYTLHDYQRDRIISFMNPYADPVGAGYNALQAMIAVGSGQLFGLGLGRGTQSRLSFLPEYHTDFVYASLGEELGLVGGAFILLFYTVLLARILKRTIDTESPFEQYVFIGIFAQIFIQVFINIGMNIGLLPITGITLPLISYGGSSIISTFIDLGLLFAVSSWVKSPLVIR